jgi:hypothetical protein
MSIRKTWCRWPFHRCYQSTQQDHAPGQVVESVGLSLLMTTTLRSGDRGGDDV